MSTSAHRVYLVALLAAISGFAGAERVALSLVMERIKVDVALTDTQLGLITGFAFSLCYSVMGFPLARWADRGNRVVVLAASAAIASIAVSLTGLGTTFLTLLAVRGAVAMADAGFLPAAMSLLTDYFSRRERPRAVAAFLQGGVVCVLVGNFVAGWISQYYGWRLMFFVLGLPGVVLAAIAWLTLSDPRNVPVSADGVASTEPGPQQAPLRPESQPGIREAVHKLARNRTYRRLLLVCSAANFTSAALAMWVPSFFIRGYGMKTGELGAYLAATGAFGGIIGHYLTGEWTYRRSAANEPRQLRAIAIAYGVMTGLSVLIYLSPNRWYALGIWMLFTMVSCVATAPLFAMIQSLFPGRMRALAMNVFTFIIGVAGLGLGPLVAGILSDELRGWGGQQSLRYASLTVCPVYLVAAWHALRASTTVAADLTLVNQQLIEPDAGDPAPVPFVTEENAR